MTGRHTRRSNADSKKVSDNEYAQIIPERSLRRRSLRIPTRVGSYEEPPGLESPKKSRLRRTSSGKACNTDEDIINTGLEKVLAAVPEDVEMHPAGMFQGNDVAGTDMYQLGTPTKNNVARRRSTTTQNGHDSKSPKLHGCVPKVLIQRCKETHKLVSCSVQDSNSNSAVHPTQYGERSRRSKNSVKSESDSLSNITAQLASTNGNLDSDNKENNKAQSDNLPKDDMNGNSRVLRPRRAKVVKDHHFESDQFFEMQSEKSRTSKNTLSKLKNRHLDEESLRKLLEKTDYIPMEHKVAMKRLTDNLKKEYSEWLHVMKEGFNILLYGLGSKRLLINDFFKEMIRDEPTLIVNGFFPSLTLKEILDDIITILLGLQTVSSQSECFNIIEKTMKSHPDRCIYLLIHNIDGGMLRSSKTQDVLSRLASIRNVHLIASVDHINAPLIWDNVKRERFNFYWITATTFLPYEAETSYEGSLLVQKSGALALMSLQNVFASLTQNAKSIYILLVKHQLASSENSQSGMAFKDLYRAAREEFLVSSDQALRSQLTEFIDHKLVKQKRNADGIETLVIPLDASLLKQFLEDYQDKSK